MELHNTRPGRSISLIKTIAISVVVGVLLCTVSFFVGVSVGRSGHNSDHLTDPEQEMPHSRVARQTDRPMFEYRISRNSINKQCSIKIRSPYREPKTCENHRNIIKRKGKAFYKCDRKKYTVEQIQNLLKNNIKIIDTCRRSHRRINCCKLAQMKNMVGSCPDGQPYSCYSDDVHEKLTQTPMCHSPRNVIPMDCKCYPSGPAVCGQEDLPKCNYPANYTECHHTSVSDDGIRHNCICTKSTEPDNLPPCSQHDTDKKNDIIVDKVKHVLHASWK